MKSIVVLAALGAFAVAAPAQGQIVAASASSAQPAARPGSIETARKLVDVMHIEQTYDRIFKPLTGLMAASLLPVMEKDQRLSSKVREELATDPGKARVGTIVKDEFYASLRARYGMLKEATAKEYAVVFTEDELQAVLAFYSSGTGAKVLSRVPEISAKMQAYGQTIGAEAGKEAYEHILDRLDANRGT